MASLPLPIGSYNLPTPSASCRRLVNCYAQVAPPERPKNQPVSLVRDAGILAWGDTGETECRGYAVFNGTLYVCAGDQVFSVNSSGTCTALTGDPITGNGVVRMLADANRIVIVPGNDDMFHSDGATVVQETDSTFTGWGALDMAYAEGYFVFIRPDSAEFFNPDVDSLTFNALKITTAGAVAGNLLGIASNRGEMVLAKTLSSERWYDAGLSPGSPFSRSPQGEYGFGCAAGRSLTTQADMTFMLTNARTFARLGGSWEPISHPGIDSVLQSMTQVSDCYAIPYTQDGHYFVAWTFPNAGRTLVHDLKTGEWHERESRIATVSLGRWRAAFVAEAYGKQIVGDSTSGKLGILDPETKEEWGEPQVMAWTYQPVYGDGKNVVHRRLEIGIAAGQGTISGQGANPKLTLFASDDGGNTFTARPLRELGKIGEYRRRVQYFNQGASRNRVYRCEVSDPVRVVVIDTQLDADGAQF